MGDSSLPISSLLERGAISILLIEDDKFMRSVIASQLEQEGYTVGQAENGSKGIAETQNGTFHLVVLDLLMPDVNGFEVLASLKKDSRTAAIPVIILSNLSSPEDIEKARGLGAKKFLVKAEHTPHEIVAEVRRVLEETYLKK